MPGGPRSVRRWNGCSARKTTPSTALQPGPQLSVAQRQPSPPLRAALPAVESPDLGSHQALMADLNKGALATDAILAAPPEEVYALESYAKPSLQIYPLPSGPGPMPQEDLDGLADLARAAQPTVVGPGRHRASDPSGLLAGWLTGNAYRPDRRGTVHSSFFCTRRRRLPAPVAQAQVAGVHPAPNTAGVERPDRPARLLPRCRDSAARPDRPDRPAVGTNGTCPGPVQSVCPPGEQPGGCGQPARRRAGEADRTWQPGDQITDRHGLLLPFDLPPGLYRIVVGLYPVEGGDRLTVCDSSSGMPSSCADNFALAQVDVEGGTAVIVPDATP